jgi:endonuclease G, mitochondrial
MTRFTKHVLIPAIFLIPAIAISAFLPRGTRVSANPNVAYGMPTAAKASLLQREDYLIERSQYVLSYNGRTLTPNWVSWRLHRDDIGKSIRGAFEPDPLLPPGITKVNTHAFDGSGFDRGHMCPAQDRSSRQADMDATFYLTNIIPQSPASNQHAWERLESYCRELTKKGKVLYICCGPHGVGGTGKNGTRSDVGRGSTLVMVPSKIWKVILVLPDENAQPTHDTRTIAIIMPNDQSVGFDWSRYRVSVSDVERLTGFRFFPNIPESVAGAIKGRVDETAVRVSAPTRSN